MVDYFSLPTAREIAVKRAGPYVMQHNFSLNSWALVSNRVALDQQFDEDGLPFDRGFNGAVALDKVCLSDLCYADDLYDLEFDAGERFVAFVDNPFGCTIGRINEVDRQYLHWVLNDSPVASIFIEKNAGRVISNGVSIRTNISPQLMVVGAIMVRYIHEKPSIVEIWSKLQPALSPDLALLVAHFIYECGDGMRISEPDTYHTMFDISSWTLQGLQRWMAHEPLTSDKKVSHGYTDYAGLYRAFSTGSVNEGPSMWKLRDLMTDMWTMEDKKDAWGNAIPSTAWLAPGDVADIVNRAYRKYTTGDTK